MAEELLTYARMKGAQVATGRCYEGEGAPAYWPWIQVIRSTVHDRPAQALASEMGTGAGYIAEIVSDVRQALPGVQKPAGSDLESSRFQLFDSVTNFLKNASRSQPMVIFLDDMHWADKPSLLLLEFLSRQLRDTRILVVCTYRDIELGRQHPLAQTLASIIREPNTRRILLRGLTEADLARYIKLTTGSDPVDSLVKAIATETEGNPFFIIETVRLLASEGRLSAGSRSTWSLTIPQGVKEVIGRRLDLLSAECNQVLTLASVLGREFDLAAVELLSDLSTETLLEALDEAVRARVLTPAAGGRYRFAHALIRETLYEELSTARRLRLHKSTGEALERLAGDDPDRFLSELAHHYFEASALGEVDKAISYARRAGDKAMQQLAFEQAAEHYDHALQALDLTEAGSGRTEKERCRLLLAMGRAQISSSELAAAHRNYRAAFTQAAESGFNVLMAEAALALGDVLTGVGSVSTELVETLEAAIAANAGQETGLRVRLLARLAEAYRFDPATSYKEDELSREAVSMARRVGDPHATAQALYARIIALGEGRETSTQVKLATELVETAKKTGDVERLLLGLRLRMIALFFTNRIPEARRDVERYTELAAEARLPLYSWFSPLFHSTWSYAEGRHEEAAALVRDGIRQGTLSRDPNVRRFTAGASLCLAYEMQDRRWLDEVTEFLGEPESFRWNWAAFIFAKIVRGDNDEAGRMLRNVVAENFEKVNTDFGLLWMMGLVADVCRRLDDTTTAEIAYDMITPLATRFAMFGYLVTTNGCGHHHLGVLATQLGRYDDARYHLDAALDLHEGAGFNYLATQTRLAQARLYRRRNAPGDADACRKALGEVIEASKAGDYKQTLEMALELEGSTDAGAATLMVPGGMAGESPIPVQAAPDGTVTILFTDIEGSTELNETLGDQLWLDLLADHDRIIRQEVSTSGGVVVKSRGDGFMLAFPSARQALMAAIGSQKALSAHNAKAPEQPPIRVRIGVHTGEVVKQSGDLFGRHVNYASRIADKARGGEILVSELTRALVQGSPEFQFGPPVPVELKGFSGSHPTFSLEWSPGE
jgi:eukaryotic-like serine/threonine-protein kinase